MRNYYLQAQADGRKSEVTCGPARADGGIQGTLYIRQHGQSVRAIDWTGYVDDNGEDLVLLVDVNDTDLDIAKIGNSTLRIRSKR